MDLLFALGPPTSVLDRQAGAQQRPDWEVALKTETIFKFAPRLGSQLQREFGAFVGSCGTRSRYSADSKSA